MVIWQAWVLFPGRGRWVMVGPLFFLFTTFGEIWIIQFRLLTPHMLGVWISVGPNLLRDYVNTIIWYPRHHVSLQHRCLYGDEPSFYLVNCLQAMVGQYFLWGQWWMLIPDRGHRKTISNLGLKTKRSHMEKVLFLLVESGVVFLGLQVSCWFYFHAHVNYATFWLIVSY